MAHIKFWANLLLVMATSYVIIWYFFSSADNQCQMTFMMEPPKFIPISLDVSNSDQSKHEVGIEKYNLFMYSELGFPRSDDISRDLRDSVPVLFVTGNAGSYQQVRSIASTCIRFQLQSLDAAKFIFYTIDFGGQLSGLSGRLVEKQIKFVQSSISKILSTFPREADGLIVIGHSVGGFVSKALFTMPDFNPRTVPILISLASPLTSPYLNFDSEMQQLYEKTSNLWNQNTDKTNQTTAVSISGGRSDHLVPMHSSMDMSYDLSLTTSSIRDVWLATDHVSITWCRELVHKIAKVLSSLIDQKTSRLIRNKQDAVLAIRRQLLSTIESDGTNQETDATNRDWKITRPYIIEDFTEEFYITTRTQMHDKVIFLRLKDTPKQQTYLIYISHIGPLKETGIYGCRGVSSSENGHINCLSRVNIMHLAQTLPSRRFEPKTTVLFLKVDNFQSMDYVVLDYSRQIHVQGSSDLRVEAIPESLSVQPIDTSIEHTLNVPSLLGYFFSVLFGSVKEQIKVDKRAALVFSKYRLRNLKRMNQLFILKFESVKCSARETPSETKIFLLQNNRLSESFHLPMNHNTTQIDIMLNQDSPIFIKGETAIDETTHLALFIDGSCENSIKLELNLLGLVINVVQKNLSVILGCVTYLSYSSVIKTAMNSQKLSGSYSSGNLRLAGLVALCLMMKIKDVPLGANLTDTLVDYLGELSLICFISCGLLAVLVYLLERLFDTTVIAANLQGLILRRLLRARAVYEKSSSANGTSKIESAAYGTLSDWLLVLVVSLAGLAFSSLANSLAQLLVILKLQLKLEGSSPNEGADTKPNERVKLQRNLIVDLGTLVALALVANIPVGLLTFRRVLRSKTWSESVPQLEFNYIVSAVSVLLIQIVSRPLSDVSTSSRTIDDKKNGSQGALNRGLIYCLHLVALMCTLFVPSDIRCINWTLLANLVWLNFNLPLLSPR